MTEKMPYAEPYRIKVIEDIKLLSRTEREQKIKEASYNLFKLKAEDVYIDLLTDSGTGSMSSAQWSALMTGDESYAGSKSFFEMKETITGLLGMPFMIPTHQGRAAENVLFSAMVKKGDIIPGNTHFDTTKGHIEFRNAVAYDCTIDEANDSTSEHPFKGNIDLKKLEKVFKENGTETIPMVILTITCNSGGGQPVSMENIKQVSQLCREHKVKLIYDMARFAENAYFIKTREQGYADKSIREIVAEMFQYADGSTMSAKKDGLVNIGGFIALRDEGLYKKCSVFTIMFEGYLTYGGMSGRDMAALAVGLKEVTEFDYLHSRIQQVKRLGDKLLKAGIPIIRPIGGHAVYVDAMKLFPHIPQDRFPAQTLGVELYKEAGVRGVEIGIVLADRDPVTRENRYPKFDLLRLAIPRRVYTDNHLDVVVWGLQQVMNKKEEYRGLKLTYEAPIMRHFTAEFAEID